MKAMVEEVIPYNKIDLKSSIYDISSATYDVTKSVEGMFHDLFLLLQECLNFSSTLHKRKDGIWGTAIILLNGTFQTEGIIQSVTSGFAEMSIAR